MRLAQFRRNIMIAAMLGLAAVPAPTQAADTVKLAAITRTVFYVPLWVAMHRGFMADEGLDLQVTFFDNAGHTDEMLRTNEMQLVLRSPEASMMDAYRGGSLRVIAGGVSKLPHFIIAQPRIKTLEQLRGANFGVLSAKEGTTYNVQDIAKSLGFTPDDYKITVVGGSPTRWKLLQRARSTSACNPSPTATRPRQPVSPIWARLSISFRTGSSPASMSTRNGLSPIVTSWSASSSGCSVVATSCGPILRRAPRLRPKSCIPDMTSPSACSATSKNTACSTPERRSTSRDCSASSTRS